MVIITFPDEAARKKALGFLFARLPFKAFKSGELFVPEAALAALANENIPFIVHGKATYEQQTAPLRNLAANKAQRRKKRTG